MKKAKWIYWIKMLASILLITVLFREINQRESIIAAFRATGWPAIGVLAVLVIPNIMLSFLKWRYLLKNRFGEISNRAVIGSLLFGYSLGLITPGRLGELARALFFRDKDKLVITGLNVLDKLTNQIVIFTLGVLSLSLWTIRRQIAGEFNMMPLIILGGFLVVLIWLIFLNPGRIRKIARRFGSKLPLQSKILSLLTAYDNLKTKNILVILGFTVMWYFVIVLQYHVLVRTFSGISLWESGQAVTAMLFTKTLLPLTFGDLGIREALAIYFYSPFGVSEAGVFNAALLVFLFNLFIPALAGLYFVFQVKDSKNKEEERASGNSSEEALPNI